MKLIDIARQGIQNLLRHRGRTLLTVLGVIVGCCSVVIMISIGIGMRLSTEATLAQMGDLNIINVSKADSSNGSILDKNVVAAIKSIDNVKAATPKLNCDTTVTLYAGNGDRYAVDWVTVTGIDLKEAELMGYKLSEGEWDALKDGQVLAGEFLDYSFRDTKRPDGHNMISRYDYYNWEDDSYSELPDAYVNVLNEPVTMILGDTYNEESASKTVTAELSVGAVLKEDWNKGYETSDGILMDISDLEKLLDKSAKLTGSKKQSEKGYNEIVVMVDNITNVEAVEKEIRKLGLQTSSMESIRKPMEQEAQQKQMLLGCVGAVSLFVAALGIANTMIMAITERIREIGVMKALGCFLKDIRKMFLLEAGCIGLIGGLIGIGLSYLISWVMNAAGGGALFSNEYSYLTDGMAMNMSVIPWWLAIFAVVFSICIGVLAGLYPAEKAVRISALEAIRRE